MSNKKSLMKIKNFEFKAKVNSLEEYENVLLELKPTFFGTDHQTDTYFNTSKGRLKLREIEGKESKLIDYSRENISGSKQSDILLYKHPADQSLYRILAHQLGIKIVVEKKRKIYGIKNVRFHLDTVEDLGTFVEVEAIDENDQYSTEELKRQCDFYYDYFKIKPEQVEKMSYSDLLMAKANV